MMRKTTSSTHGRTLHELHRGTYRFLRTPLWLNALVVSSEGGGTLAERATGVAAVLSDYYYSGATVKPDATWLASLSSGRYVAEIPRWVFQLIFSRRVEHRESLAIACRNVAAMLSDYFYGGTNATPHS